MNVGVVFPQTEIGSDPVAVRQSLLCLLKTRRDRESLAPEVVDRLVARAV